MDEDEQKQYFQNWTTEKICDTRDIDFAEWQKEHSTREAYFFGWLIRIIQIFYFSTCT